MLSGKLFSVQTGLVFVSMQFIIEKTVRALFVPTYSVT